ncbi:unnamed protein product, partial [Sphenostylis stenocarpa]
MLGMGYKCKDPRLTFIGGARRVGTAVWVGTTVSLEFLPLGRPSHSKFGPETGVSNVGRASHLKLAIWDGRLDPWDNCLELF